MKRLKAMWFCLGLMISYHLNENLATLAKKCRMSRGQLIDGLVRGFGDKVKPQKPAHLR